MGFSFTNIIIVSFHFGIIICTISN